MSAITSTCVATAANRVRSERDSAAFSGMFEMTADTHPDAAGPLAAPADCKNPIAYRMVIRERYRSDPAARQQMLCLARRLEDSQYRTKVPVTGPFAEDARDMLTLIHRSATEERRKKR